EKHGDYQAAAIVLLFSSHDWQDQMTFQNVVGNTPFYPQKNPQLAIADAIYWVYTRLFDTVDWNNIGIIKNAITQEYEFNTGWDDFIGYTSDHNVPLLV